MKILLDTHILLWTLLDSTDLSKRARYWIQSEETEIYYSLASLWEVQIKHMNHPRELAVDAEAIEMYCREAGFRCLPINSEHIKAFKTLKAPEGSAHKDPFDRIMMCQAKTENMLFFTADRRVLQYEEPCLYGV